MANWPDLMFRARVFAANEPGFLANQFLELVALNGGPLGYSLNVGVNLATPEGRAMADFHAALALFCYQLRDLGVGHLPFQPVAQNNVAGPVVPDAPGAPGGAAPPAADDNFVEIIGGVHPVHGPWVVDHDFVEIIGGVHPVHGPWVEGEPPAANMDFDIPAAGFDALAGGLLQQPNQDDGDNGQENNVMPLQGMEDGELPNLEDWDFDINLFLQ
jgi:hypothetical protein